MPAHHRAGGPQSAAAVRGLVVAAHGRRYRVETSGAVTIDCVTRGKKSDVACGDRVEVVPTGAGTGVIDRIEPRRSLFYRSDARRQKLIAANVTQIAVVVAPRPVPNPDLVNRCLVGAEHAGIAALVVFNKIDLPEAAEVSASLDLYRALDYAVVPLSAKRDVAPLSPCLADNLSVLVGQSGTGKSTIINALVPQAAARVAEISSALGTGRHTTTHAELYHLAGSGDLIDSPGLQEFGLHHLSADEAAAAFREFRPFLGHCRFRDCRHVAEPGCAISAAVSEGLIAGPRVESYRRLAGELARKPEHWESRTTS
jgi:ribosome biogenesis GTPase